ncbi:exonuclease domain-containing protein [Rhodovulum tesquicola]|uniref:3'-5' exonuclease n=1 Tax=Rhodovulum tesquicola TaxID=540254 RepID=UPI002098458E|nr:exonuclease domain-containing protein [Rhodovulum tesquicola]MCO8146692.1 exonuclease domain-containing protein [Rhodovulum tesquicola]
MDVRIKDLFFLDFEASSLEPHSWPIEIGMAWIDGSEIGSWSSLIRPDPRWEMEGWHEASARIHGITPEELQQAPPASEVAAIAADMLAGRHPVSDAPEFEKRWARRLFQTIGQPTPEFLGFDLIVSVVGRPPGFQVDGW